MTFYRSNTFNQTFYVDASASSGYKNNIVQTGNIQNQGIELALGYSDTFDKVKVSTNFTYTLNQTRIVSLAEWCHQSGNRRSYRNGVLLKSARNCVIISPSLVAPVIT